MYIEVSVCQCVGLFSRLYVGIHLVACRFTHIHHAAQLPWPERPLPKLSNPFRPTAAEWRAKIAHLRANGQSAKEEHHSVKVETKRMKPDETQLIVDLDASDLSKTEVSRPLKRWKTEHIEAPTQDPKYEIFVINRGEDVEVPLRTHPCTPFFHNQI